ncbi:MAG: T9SS type A sorting domain-containing protein, partial [candidate division WOR-3 bacterium]
STHDRLKYAKSTEPVGIKEGEQLSDIESHIPTLQAHPNPFSDKTNIILHVSNEQLRMKHFSLKIYDVSGKLIKSFLFLSSNSSRATSVGWDGKDSSDKQLPNGVYFIKFKAGDYIETRKLLLIR